LSKGLGVVISATIESIDKPIIIVKINFKC